ncbi:MAG: hypothetical protein F4W90_01040 [Gammaproteobacteria bacterium]|nr:hypothetical protein [Gammaproteobacteria bacterium]
MLALTDKLGTAQPMSGEILYEKHDGIAVITLHRPEKLNAITDEMLADFTNITNETMVDDDVRAVVLTGSGRAFCAGTDVSAGIARDHAAAAIERNKRIKPIDVPESTLPRLWTMARIPKPTIAAVNGAAVGVGVEWTIQCDFRVAAQEAKFGWVFALRAITPDTGAGPYLLPYIVGLPKALELMYSGRIIDADEALAIGLVSRVVPKDALLDTAIEFAQGLTNGAPLAVKGIKELTYGSLEWPPSVFDGHKTALLQATSNSEDAQEGVDSFLQKRPPRWRGK